MELDLLVNSNEYKLLMFMNREAEAGNPYISTLVLSKYIFGNKATCRDINPLLYKLKSKNLVVKISEENGKTPKWKRVEREENLNKV